MRVIIFTCIRCLPELSAASEDEYIIGALWCKAKMLESGWLRTWGCTRLRPTCHYDLTARSRRTDKVVDNRPKHFYLKIEKRALSAKQVSEYDKYTLGVDEFEIVLLLLPCKARIHMHSVNASCTYILHTHSSTWPQRACASTHSRPLHVSLARSRLRRAHISVLTCRVCSGAVPLTLHASTESVLHQTTNNSSNTCETSSRCATNRLITCLRWSIRWRILMRWARGLARAMCSSTR